MIVLRLLTLVVFPVALFVWSFGSTSATLSVGSKKFTESVILGELITQLIDDALGANDDVTVDHRSELGGTPILWNALLAGEIDAYPEYIGTLLYETFADQNLETVEELAAALDARGLVMTEPLGFENNYAIGMRRERAEALGIVRVSDLRQHSSLKLRFNPEFLERADGWPGLRDAYRLPHERVVGVDHDVAYELLAAGEIDAKELYTTDPEIDDLDLTVLEDDLGYFNRYPAIVVYRKDLTDRHPEAVDAIQRLAGAVSAQSIRTLNKRAEVDKVTEPQVAREFLQSALGLAALQAPPDPQGAAVLRAIEPVNVLQAKVTGYLVTRDDVVIVIDATRGHLQLVLASLAGAIVIGLPLGLIAGKTRWAGQVILTGTGLVQTIPSIALLALLIQPLSSLKTTLDGVALGDEQSLNDWLQISGLGFWPSVIALFLYSLLPIVRNTATGIRSIPPGLQESAQALGLKRLQRWRRIELPLAAPTILAGIKTAAVLNIGFAALGALIGAGGYGDPILRGIRLSDERFILLGALPAAGLAILAQLYFELAERVTVSGGLRLRTKD